MLSQAGNEKGGMISGTVEGIKGESRGSVFGETSEAELLLLLAPDVETEDNVGVEPDC